ncbi:MAG: NACHT domain-containing protein [Aphanothece sp. CMT-3BRIN-NPC111]|nr:NACHT domain-containing protein [Aphanothece sp. CMT-3BRIN-NPC111]
MRNLDGVFTSITRRNVQTRYKLLDKVNREITQRLESSLHNVVPLELLKERQLEQAQRLWDVEVKIGKRPTYQLSPQTSITQVFDDTGGKLLILGAQGAGKTTTLLELAKDLVARAENDPKQPIPVLFNLSSWQEDKQSIAEWLVVELQAKYSVRVYIAKQWIEQQQLLPLLDGLDELDLTRQERCIEALNQLLEGKHRQQQLVVCTRLEDYKSCNNWLRLHGAVYLRSLTEAQIRDYLMGVRSRELWENIKTEPTLLALAKTPLLLCLMTLAYEEILIHSWKRLTSKEERQVYLLNAYIRRMLTRDINRRWYRQGKEPRSEKTRYWLIWLAKKMKQEKQTEFLIESIQPSWLPTYTQKQIYRIAPALVLGLVAAVGCGLWGGGIFGLVGGLIGVLISTIPGVRYFTLRLLLCWNGYIPWNYTRFLNYASERLLMQRFDRRYLFIHDLLQEHFAQMPLN